MPDVSPPDVPLELLPGTVDLLVLRALVWGPLHGFAVACWVRRRTDGVLALEDAPLYKALHRLERRGDVVAEWGLSEHKRRARYYQLTPAGRARLGAEASAWRRYAAAVSRVLDPALDAALDPAPGV
ncbi:PadR family transcriptional regulator [Roseisolibacter agri]|uniref:PadR family transcriptional regulator n=1 Tax=Roseisolibacter agri TaxID=2014610 RepID=A0AA37V4N4_9BACT|nr:PadR family transcriptional regulator [Roseisolibacter agri]GLC28167.1 PadR family transcriptional regulator [Roseisolibacter agri]